MQSKAITVAEYLASLPLDRRTAIQALRETIFANLDKDYREAMIYGMIGFVIPHSIYPPGYHCDPKLPLPFVYLGSQKGHMSLHLMCVYGDPAQESKLREGFAKAGKKIDMGKACLRFKKIDDLSLEVIGKLIANMPAKAYIKRYEEFLQQSKKPAQQIAISTAAKSPATKSPVIKSSTKKSAAKSSAPKPATKSKAASSKPVSKSSSTKKATQLASK